MAGAEGRSGHHVLMVGEDPKLFPRWRFAFGMDSANLNREWYLCQHTTRKWGGVPSRPAFCRRIHKLDLLRGNLQLMAQNLHDRFGNDPRPSGGTIRATYSLPGVAMQVLQLTRNPNVDTRALKAVHRERSGHFQSNPPRGQ